MGRPHPGTLRERFDALWTPEPNTGCWLWFGRRPFGRYGYFSVRGAEMRGGVSVTRYKDRLAHRLAWELERGAIPDGMYVCHTCDVAECVNPDHMFLGTQFDNMRDCAKKGRDARTRATHCTKGHEYTAENTITTSRKYRRQCRTCKETRRLRARARYHENPERARAQHRAWYHSDPERARAICRASYRKKKAQFVALPDGAGGGNG